MKNLLRLAVLCGVLPLVAGIGIFVAWVITEASWLTMAGLLTINVGVYAVVVGLVLLIVYMSWAWQGGQIPRRRLVGQTLAVVALFAANFVAAGGAVMGAQVISSRYTVVVTNQSNAPLQSARIEGGGVAVEFGDIPPGATVSESFWIKHDGQLTLSGRHGSNDVHAVIADYVTNGQGDYLDVTVDPNGNIIAPESNLD